MPMTDTVPVPRLRPVAGSPLHKWLTDQIATLAQAAVTQVVRVTTASTLAATAVGSL